MNGRRLGAVAALAVVLLAAGCGVPDHTSPVAVDSAPGAGEPAERSGGELPEQSRASGPIDLVQRFLQASAAGDWDGVREQRLAQAAKHLRTFMTPEAGRTWVPRSTQVLVVDPRQLSIGADGNVLAVLRPVGVLDQYGAVEPVPPGTPPDLSHTFVIDQMRIGNAPPTDGLLLSTEGLANLYTMRPIYFWDRADRYLVPDLRYLAKGLTREKRASEIVDRVLHGPSSYLESGSTVLSLPSGTNRPDSPVPQRNNKIAINLSVQARSDPGRLNKIARQLRWSLNEPGTSVSVELQVESQPVYTDTGPDYLAVNPAVLPKGGTDDQRLYAIAGGKVVAVNANRPVPVFSAAENENVALATARRDGNAAALVRNRPGGQDLFLGRFMGGETTGPRYTRARLECAAMSRPVMLPGSARVLVACGGRLWDVGDDGQPTEVNLGGRIDSVTALSLAPDGRRLALVAHEKVYVTTISAEAAPTTVGPLRELYTAPLATASGVAWRYEHQLIVSGVLANPANGNGLVDVSIDNAYRMQVPVGDRGRINSLAAVPNDPSTNAGGTTVLDAAGQAYSVYSALNPMVRKTGPSASPGVGPSAGPPPQLYAPFFLE